MNSHKQKIDKIITLEKENNLWNHILTNLFHRGETLAEKNSNQYILWTTNYMIGTFYPIFKISFNEKNEINKIETELSIYGKIWFLILSLFILGFTTSLIIIPFFENLSDFDFTFLIPVILYGLLIFGIYVVLKKIYINEKKYLLNELRVTVGVETQNNIDRIEEQKNEWSFKMTIFRFFAYPFSIFIIIMSAYMIYKGDLRGLFGIFIGIGYLLSDIRIIQKKRKKTKANTS